MLALTYYLFNYSLTLVDMLLNAVKVVCIFRQSLSHGMQQFVSLYKCTRRKDATGFEPGIPGF